MILNAVTAEHKRLARRATMIRAPRCLAATLATPGRTHYKDRSACKCHAMTEPIMSALDAVLDRIDQNLEQSLDRLFALLRIA